MDFIPETVEALGELDPLVDDLALGEKLRRASEQAEVIAPGLAGISVAAREHGITFTLVATDEDTSVLDAVQYLTSGPCVEGLDVAQGLATTADDMFSERRWRALGQASAALGVRSTLTLPVLDADRVVVGTINLYGTADDTFEGRHARLAEVFSAWAPGAVTNADLSFSTRRLAEEAPERLREESLIDVAVGILAASYDVPAEAARDNLHDAAARAGVPVVALARTVVELIGGTD